MSRFRLMVSSNPEIVEYIMIAGFLVFLLIGPFFK